MTKTIERYERGLFGKIVALFFILWNVLMAWWLISFLESTSTNPAFKDLTPDNRNAAIGLGVIFQIFIWSLSALVLGAFVQWTKGPRTTETTEE